MRPRAGHKEVRGHGNGVDIGDADAARRAGGNGNAVRVRGTVDVPVGDEMGIACIRLQRRTPGAFCRAIVQNGHDALESPLLALRDVLRRSAGWRRIPVNAFEERIARMANGG